MKTVTDGNAVVNLCTPSELARVLEERRVWRWYMRFGIVPRGLAIRPGPCSCKSPPPTQIYVREDARDLEGLLAHELGHADGLEHAYLPTTMCEAWPLRLFDVEGLRPRARRVLEALHAQ